MNKDSSELGYSFWKSRGPNPNPARIPRSKATEASSQGLTSINSFKSVGGVGHRMGKWHETELGLYWACVEGGYVGGGMLLTYHRGHPSSISWSWGLPLERTVTFAGHIVMLAQGKAGTTCIWAGKHKTPMNTDELLPAAFTDVLYLSSLRCHTLLTLPPPPAPGPLLKGKAGSGVGRGGDGSTELPGWGACLNVQQSVWSQGLWW